MNIKIIVATHKKYRMPDDEMYLPVHVGAEGKTDADGNPLDLGFTKDNTGDNISAKNYCYCELTGLYWEWKNVEAEYLGLVHYRRHFRGRLFGRKFDKILTGAQAEKLLAGHSVLLPKKRHYYIETNRSQYIHAHHAEGLDCTEQVINEFWPDYSAAFANVMDRTAGHRFNMMIMRRDLFNDYCAWLFDVLFKVESRIDISEWTPVEQRVFGYLSERLLDVWLEKNCIEYRDIPYEFMENQNWFKKIAKFISRKFGRG